MVLGVWSEGHLNIYIERQSVPARDSSRVCISQSLLGRAVGSLEGLVAAQSNSKKRIEIR